VRETSNSSLDVYIITLSIATCFNP